MVTFKAIVIDRRKDGSWPVWIRVYFAGKSRRIRTTIVARADEVSRGRNIKSAEVQRRADEVIAKMRRALGDLSYFDTEGRDVDWVVQRIRNGIREEAFSLDFFAWADEAVKGKAEKTRADYISALSVFRAFLGRDELDVNEVTKDLLTRFVDWLGKDGRRKPATVSDYVMKLGHLYRSARDRYNDEDAGLMRIPRQPFSGVKVPAGIHVGQRNLGREVMQRIISAAQGDEMLALFVVSFGLMGMNLADLWEARPCPSGVLVYHRKKTRGRRADRAEMRVEIPGELRPFLARLQDGPSGWLLPALHRYKSNAVVTAVASKSLKAWAASEGLDPFTFYAARHSWASLARSIGVEKALVDECLAHVGDYEIADIYAERSWDLINAANRRVLDLFQWPEF